MIPCEIKGKKMNLSPEKIVDILQKETKNNNEGYSVVENLSHEIILKEKDFMAIAQSIETMCQNSDRTLYPQYYVYDCWYDEMYFEEIGGIIDYLENYYQEKFNEDFQNDKRCQSSYEFKIVLLVEVDGTDDEIYIASYNDEIVCDEQVAMFQEHNTIGR